MDIQELTKEMHKFVCAMGWYKPTSQRPQTLRNLAISLNLEAAEVLEHFQWMDSQVDRDSLASELADVALYLLQLASLAEIDLEQAVMAKLKMNYHRTWDISGTSSENQADTSSSVDAPDKDPSE